MQSNTVQYTCVDLACVPSDYASRAITVSLFDVGDGYQGYGGAHGNAYLSVAPPVGSVPHGTTIPISEASAPPGMSTQDGDQAAVRSRCTSSYAPYCPFNGLWLTATFQVPSNYTGMCVGNSGWLQLAYMVSNSGLQPNDKVGVGFSLVGSPVHLVPATLG